jgi:TPR repeat protein
LPSTQTPGNISTSKVAWCRDVIGLVDRLYVAPNQTGSADPPSGPIHVADQELNNLVEIAIPMILQFANPNPVPQPLPLHIAESIYLRATFEATGAYPQFVPQNPRMAFRDFERAARAGFSAAWFKLGRDYENFGDFSHAKDCYERGIRNNNESSLYRLGMAHLMGQLGLSPSPEAALPLLQHAATLATVDVPQPAYVFGLLLLGEFSQASIPPHLFTPLIPPGSTRDNEARRHLERAAYLNFAPAQYKLGHAYEFAQPPFPFDALLSVQYYSLASQQGEFEADMALSKWFLCGSDGAFDKDESLAFTFAEKAARKGLPSAEFAMGYYTEVGVGGLKDIEAARKWYTRASQHGNADATERLAALSQPAPAALSRQEHDNLTETTLVRKRTQAKQRSDARGPTAGPRQGRSNGQQVVANIRKNSLAHRPGPGPNRGYPPSPDPATVRYVGNAPEGYPAQQVPLSSSPGSSGGGYRGPIQPDNPRSRQPSLSASQPQGSNNVGPGGYPSPRIPSQRPPSQPQLGGPGPSGQQGRRTKRGGSGSGNPSFPPGPSSSQQQQARVRTPSPTGLSDPPVRPPPAKGPATFQEMGFQSEKLEGKECVIM